MSGDGSYPFRELSQNIRDVARVAERFAPQPRGFVDPIFNRTLEVWGSIPHVSTRKRNRSAQMRAGFVFGGARESFRNSRGRRCDPRSCECDRSAKVSTTITSNRNERSRSDALLFRRRNVTVPQWNAGAYNPFAITL
jgi:hypothetical protein